MNILICLLTYQIHIDLCGCLSQVTITTVTSYNKETDESSYPSVPRPASGGLGGFCVGGFVRDRVPPLMD